MHFGDWSSYFFICSWPIPQQVKHTKLGPDYQYFSTTFIMSPKQKPKAHNFFPLFLLFIVITIMEPYLLLVFCCFLYQLLLISYQSRVFSSIPIANSTSFLSSSIFSLLRYLTAANFLISLSL